jgi:alkaline phosphatase
MSYPQFQAASDYLGAIADEDYVKALPSNSYEDRGGAVLDGPEAGYKVTYTQADAEAVTAEDGRVILMDEHLADSDAMDYDMDRADGEWALSDYVQKGIEVLDNGTRFFMMCEGGKIDWVCFQPSPGRFPSSADGSGFTHLLLMYMNLD